MPAYKCIYGLCSDKVWLPVCNRIFGCTVSPNTITLVNLLVVLPLCLYTMYIPNSNTTWVCFIALIALNRLLDIADGHCARVCNRKSKTGAILDIAGDAMLAIGVTVVVCLRHPNAYIKLVLVLIAAVTLKEFAACVIAPWHATKVLEFLKSDSKS